MRDRREKIINELIKNYACYSVSKSAQEQVQKWLISNSYTQEKEKALWNLWNEIEPEYIGNAEESLCDIKRTLGIPVLRMAVPKKQPQRKEILRRQILRVAAVLLPFILIIGVSRFIYTKRANVAEQVLVEQTAAKVLASDDLEKQLILDDGTEVWLNKQSVLSYTPDRKTTLVGESFFNVKKNDGEKFVVNTEFLSATVVGTSFNIQACPESDVVVISLYEGILDVKSSDLSLRLEAGKELVYNKISSEVTVNNISRTKPDWARNIINFDRATIRDVFKSLECIYNIKIECKDALMMDDLITLKFEKNVNIDEVMFFMSKISGKFDYKITANNVIINTIK